MKKLSVLLMALLMLFPHGIANTLAAKAEYISDEKWDVPERTFVSAGNSNELGATQIPTDCIDEVIHMKDRVGGWFSFVAPISGDYTFTVNASGISDSYFDMVFYTRVPERRKIATLKYEKSPYLQRHTLENIEAGTVLYWWDRDNSGRGYTALGEYDLRISVVDQENGVASDIPTDTHSNSVDQNAVLTTQQDSAQSNSKNYEYSVLDNTIPWYVDTTNVLWTLNEADIHDVGGIVRKTTLTENPDEIEYIINSEGAQILFDDGNRAILLGDSMLYLCKRDTYTATVQAAIKTSDFWGIDSVYSEGIERAQSFGNGVLFTTTDSSRTYALYYLDWDNVSLYKISRLNTIYPSFEAGYWVCKTDKGAALIIDFKNEKVYTGTVQDNWNMNRVTEQGAVLYVGTKPKAYLHFENMTGYGTLLEGKIAFVGDDYYIRINDYTLEKVTETTKSTWIKKVDDKVLQYDDVHYEVIGNMLYYSSDGGGTVVFMGDTADQGVLLHLENTSIGSYATPTRRYMAVNFASRYAFSSNWHILQLGSNLNIQASKAKASLMQYSDFFITESVDGYLMNRKDDLLSGKGYCYRKLTENGYYIYIFSENRCLLVKFCISDNPSVDALK